MTVTIEFLQESGGGGGGSFVTLEKTSRVQTEHAMILEHYARTRKTGREVSTCDAPGRVSGGVEVTKANKDDGSQYDEGGLTVGSQENIPRTKGRVRRRR